jgi:hypothetical protein
MQLQGLELQRDGFQPSSCERKLHLCHALLLKFMLYTMEDNDAIVVTDVKDLREGFLYYALTVNEELPKRETVRFTTLEEFFEKLKTDQDLDENDVQIIKDCLEKQKIKFKQLMNTGELAMTDQKLNEYGVAQGGLRTAILAVIKSGN